MGFSLCLQLALLVSNSVKECGKLMTLLLWVLDARGSFYCCGCFASCISDCVSFDFVLGWCVWVVVCFSGICWFAV